MTFLPSGLMAVLFHFVFYFVIPFGPFVDSLVCCLPFIWNLVMWNMIIYLFALRFVFIFFYFVFSFAFTDLQHKVLSSSSDTRNQFGFKALKKKLIVLISLRWFICLLVI